ncbi:MAG: dihydrolipoyl dehydrogenase [Treponema sp.]|jgi:dihydrolipoamide dehydrogenase|nr:dihydrolipoyl dehydrogenase [Treponema sp.]
MYDTIIIGGGPGGYLAAERLGHAGKKVLLIEEQYLGGTCLNAGCIPTKTLLNSAKQYVHAREAGKFGVTAEKVSFDWGAMQKWKAEVVEKLRGGIASQMKRFGVDVAGGRGEILAAPAGDRPGKVRVSFRSGESAVQEHEGRTILICAGSVPALPPIPGGRDNPLAVDSTGLLAIEGVPKRLAVIGGGVIGVEFAGLFSSLGAEVTVIEMMDEIVPFMDKEQAPLLRRAMKDVKFKLGCRVEKIEGATVHYSAGNGKTEQAQADVVLVAAGRRPVLGTWGAEAAGLDITSKGVTVDDKMRTNISGIWAAGDVTGRSLLAHSAYRMAEVAAADILVRLDGAAASCPPNRMRYDAVPWAVYGLTEAAGTGLTEQEAAAKGIAILKASLPMRASGRFAAENTFAGQGAVKVIACADTRRILGVHAVGAYASEFIWGGAALIEQELRIEDVKQLIFPHPTVCELIRDAVWELNPPQKGV